MSENGDVWRLSAKNSKQDRGQNAVRLHGGIFRIIYERLQQKISKGFIFEIKFLLSGHAQV